MLWPDTLCHMALLSCPQSAFHCWALPPPWIFNTRIPFSLGKGILEQAPSDAHCWQMTPARPMPSAPSRIHKPRFLPNMFFSTLRNYRQNLSEANNRLLQQGKRYPRPQ